MNSRSRWREVLRVCHRQEVIRHLTPPDWQEWDHCPDCAAAAGQPCYDVLGATTAWRVTDRMNPHAGRLPRNAEVDSDG